MAIHLFNPLWDASGGSEWRTLSLFELLAAHDEVAVWTEYPADVRLLGRFPIREMLKTGVYPTSGTFVFVGVYWQIGPWLKRASPDRVILTYNVVDPDGLENRIHQLQSYGINQIELRFSSAMMAEHANGRPGTVEVSPIDLDVFSPRLLAHEGIVVGRHSRDHRFKHHPEDPDLYRQLASEGVQIRILGGTCLEELEGVRGIELLPTNSVPAADFLNGLDIFFYRTDPAWTETFGRVVAEAMACGLPCVVERGGGYESLIHPGEDGFLFESGEEARGYLARLIGDATIRGRMGNQARRAMTDLYDLENRKLVDYYLGR